MAPVHAGQHLRGRTIVNFWLRGSIVPYDECSVAGTGKSLLSAVSPSRHRVPTPLRVGNGEQLPESLCVGVLGGAGILALFPAGSDLFGAYGIGLALGFFGYFLVLIILVTVSKDFDADWFLDGRRKRPEEPFYVPGEIVTPPRPPMVVEEDGVVDR